MNEQELSFSSTPKISTQSCKDFHDNNCIVHARCYTMYWFNGNLHEVVQSFFFVTSAGTTVMALLATDGFLHRRDLHDHYVRVVLPPLFFLSTLPASATTVVAIVIPERDPTR